MDELWLGVTADVVVTEEGIRVDLVRQVVRLPIQRLLVGVVTNANSSTQDEVHLEDLFFFVIDDILFFLVAKVARFESKGHIVQEFTLLVLLGIKEEPEVVEDVIE